MSETIYINRDNVVRLQLLKNDVEQSLLSVNRIDAILGTTTISNTTSTAWPIKWSGLTEVGEVQLKLGPENIPTKYRGKMWIVLYDPLNTYGLVWSYVKVEVNIV